MRRILLLAGSLLTLTGVERLYAANLTPPMLGAQTSITTGDLFTVWPVASNGPLKAITWANVEAALSLGTAASANTGTSGGTLCLLNANCTHSGIETFNAEIFTVASNTSYAGINLAPGVAPTTPSNGDCWITSTAFNCQIGGATATFMEGANNLSELTNAATARTNIGLPIGTSGAVVCILNGSACTFANNPLVPTASAGDSSTKVADTAFVVGRGAQFQAQQVYSANHTLTQSDAGLDILVSGASTTITFPGLSSVTYALSNQGTAPVTFAFPNGTDFRSSLLLYPGERVILASDQGGASAFYRVMSLSYQGAILGQNSQSAPYTFAMTDAANQVYHPSSDTTARTWTIPANGSVAFGVGTKIDVVNDCSAGVLTIAITSDTLVWFPAGSTGSRSVAACGEVTLTKIGSTRWAIAGVGIS
jgi:hypothetical protein